MSNTLIITGYKNGLTTALFDEKSAVDLFYQENEDGMLVGDICIGKVQKVMKNLAAAFIDLPFGQTGYYPLNQNQSPVYTKKGASKDIQQGDELLVQISRDSVKTKAVSLSAELTVTGSFAVVIPNGRGISVSAKLDRDTARTLKEKVLSYAGSEHISFDYTGMILRTNAAGVSDEELFREISFLLKEADRILSTAQYRTFGSVLYRRPRFYIGSIQNLRDRSTLIKTDLREVYDDICDFFRERDPQILSRVSFYEDRLLPLGKLYSLDKAFEEAQSERVWLKSGGYLVIQPTEALTVIDVNTGKYEGKKNTEEAFFRINREAARESARQIRLRSLSGIIIIDFINMEEKEHQETVLEELKNAVKTDPVRTVLVDMTPLGLVEVTRKRQFRSLKEQLTDKF